MTSSIVGGAARIEPRSTAHKSSGLICQLSSQATLSPADVEEPGPIEEKPPSEQEAEDTLTKSINPVDTVVIYKRKGNRAVLNTVYSVG